jgi:hypothetical protein
MSELRNTVWRSTARWGCARPYYGQFATERQLWSLSRLFELVHLSPENQINNQQQ